MNQFGDVENTRDLLAQIITSGYMGDVAVDSTFFVSSIDGTCIIIHGTERRILRFRRVMKNTNLKPHIRIIWPS